MILREEPSTCNNMPRAFQTRGGGGTPIETLYGDVPPNGSVFDKNP